MRKLKHEEIKRPSLSALQELDRHPISLLVDNIRSAHNIGSIFRTADAVRAEQIILTGISPPANHKGVHKSALGAQDAVPWKHEPSALNAASSLKQSGYTLVALELTDNPSSIESLSFSIFPVCLMIGNEVTGLSDELLGLADVALEIPQYGFKQSLNVSVASGIAMYGLLALFRNHSEPDSMHR